MTLLKDNNYKEINVALLSLEADIKNKIAGFDTSVIDKQLAEINSRIDKINAGDNNTSDEIEDINYKLNRNSNKIRNIEQNIEDIGTKIDDIEQKLSDIFSAENKVTDFNTTTDSGIYYWVTDAANRPTDYGVLLVNKYDSGNTSIWINQIAYGTNNKIYFRQNINSGNWTEWKAVAFEGEENADTVDNYHASQLWRSDGATWNPNANVSLNATANGDEWSFDISRNGHTGCYWHVWDSSRSSLLKVNADDGKVSAPYGFVGDLSGKADTAGKASFLDEYPGAGGTRLTSGNIVPKDSSEYGGMRKDVVTSSMTDGSRPGQDGHLLTMFWDNSARYDSQLYISNDVGVSPILKVRQKQDGADYGPWTDIITSNNIGSQTVARADTAGTADKTVNDITIDIPWAQESGQYVIPLGNILQPGSADYNSPYNWDIAGFFSIIRPAGHAGVHITFEAGHGYSHGFTTYAFLDEDNFTESGSVRSSIKAFQYNGEWWLGLWINTQWQGYTSKMTVTYSRGLPATPTCILYNSQSGGVANAEIYNSIQDIPGWWWRRRTIYNPTTFTQNITSPVIQANNKMVIPIGEPSSLEDGCIWIER